MAESTSIMLGAEGRGAWGSLKASSVVDRWLFYVKGGGAWTNEKVDDAFTKVDGTAVDPSTSTTRTGWTSEPAWSGHWHETGRQRSSMITTTSAARELR